MIKYYITEKHLATFQNYTPQNVLKHTIPFTDQRHVEINTIFWLKCKTEKPLKNPWRAPQMRLTQAMGI